MTKRIKSFDAFSEKLQRQRPQQVIIQADRRPEGGAFSKVFSVAVGELGDFSHGLLYTVSRTGRLGRRRKEQYLEHRFTAVQSSYGADVGAREGRAMSLLLLGASRSNQLRDLLPETQVYLAGSNPQVPIPEAALERLHEQARQRGVTPDLTVEP